MLGVLFGWLVWLVEWLVCLIMTWISYQGKGQGRYYPQVILTLAFAWERQHPEAPSTGRFAISVGRRKGLASESKLRRAGKEEGRWLA